MASLASGGDSGTVISKAILTAGNPEGDVLWGLDNTLLSRAVSESGLFVPYESTELAKLDPATTALVPGHEVTPVDTGDVCLNYDKAWFSEQNLTPPASLDDLIKPEYKDLLVVENPSTSSPGLAFLLASVAKFGPTGFVHWWTSLRSNGVTVVDSWDAAYYNEFTAGGGDGKKPIVVSYASSLPATIVFAADPKPTEPTTGNNTNSVRIGNDITTPPSRRRTTRARGPLQFRQQRHSYARCRSGPCAPGWQHPAPSDRCR